MSDEEHDIFVSLMEQIRNELGKRHDELQDSIIVGYIELVLNFCQRFYNRQFLTRKLVNSDILMKFDNLMRNYYEQKSQMKSGLPTVQYCADKLCMSSNYFGDLIKKETGKSAQEYIQTRMIDLAKEKIAGTEKTVSQIAYELGYQYSQHFNRVFKKNVGYTPSEYRHLQV